MQLKRYVPFIGGLVLFVLALWASNANVSFTPQEARADDPECTPLANGACLEIYDVIAGGQQIGQPPKTHLTGGGTSNEKDWYIVKVVYHVPTAQGEELEGLPSLALYLSDGEDTIEMYRTTGDSSNGFHTELLGFEPEGGRHDYSGYTVFAVLDDRTFDGGWQYDTVVQTANTNLGHPVMKCGNDIDDDDDYKPEGVGVDDIDGIDFDGGPATSMGPVPVDPHCISLYDDSEDIETTCSNGIDDDLDGKKDYPADDDHCTSWSDNSELFGTFSPTPS